MRLKVIGYDERAKEPFDYYIENVVAVNKVFDKVFIQVIDENQMPYSMIFEDNGLTHLYLDING